MVIVDLLQDSLSLSYSNDPLLCTLHDVVREGWNEKERLVNFEKSRFKTELKMQDLL